MTRTRRLEGVRVLRLRDRAGRTVAAGFYTVRLRAVPGVAVAAERNLPLAQRVTRSFSLGREELVDQSYDIRVGNVAAPRMPQFAALPHGLQRRGGTGNTLAPATGSLPYTRHKPE